jgi:hypothetical protein
MVVGCSIKIADTSVAVNGDLITGLHRVCVVFDPVIAKREDRRFSTMKDF